MRCAASLLLVSLALWSALGLRAAPLPEFFSSDPAHDELLNDMWRRHLQIDYSPGSLRGVGNPVPGSAGSVWEHWNVDMLGWFDCGPANLPLDNRPEWIRSRLETVDIDRFGYVYSTQVGGVPYPATMEPNQWFLGTWPFPEYNNSGSRAKGYEWNTASSLQGWTALNVTSGSATSSVGGDGWWRGGTTAANTGGAPLLISPNNLGVNSFHAPFLLLSIQYDQLDAAMPASELQFQVWWTTNDDTAFGPDKAVASNSFPLIPIPQVQTGSMYIAYLPMYLHPKWRGQTAADSKTIRQIWVNPHVGTGRATKWRMNCLRMNYDSRIQFNNPAYVNACARKFFWDGDTGFLQRNLPRIRAAMQFCLYHLHGIDQGQISTEWLVGHNGQFGKNADGTPNYGNGIGGSYWDAFNTGSRDLLTSIEFWQALHNMARIEDFVALNPGLDSAPPTVMGPDNNTPRSYMQSGATLRALADIVRQNVDSTFWNPTTGRYGHALTDDNRLQDYGNSYHNLLAIESGMITDAGRTSSIMGWLDGSRSVAGDAISGAALYDKQFAIRSTTAANARDYSWGFPASFIPFGTQVQNGGAMLWYTYYDVRARLALGDTTGAWSIWNSMVQKYSTIRAAGGAGDTFYRTYYNAHPEEGTLQGGPTTGALGLDIEFIENLLSPSAWVRGWLGVDAPEAGVLRIAPTLPASLAHIGARNLVWRGNTFTVRHREDLIDLRGSSFSNPAAGSVRIDFPGSHPVGTQVWRNGLALASGWTRDAQGRVSVMTAPASPDVYQLSSTQPATPFVWTFDQANYADEGLLLGFNGGGGSYSTVIAGGALTWTMNAISPSYLSPSLRLEAGQYPTLRCRIRNGTPATAGALFWSNETHPNIDGSCVLTFPITANDSGYRDYVIDLRVNPQWTGVIGQVRLDPALGFVSGTMALDQFSLDRQPVPVTLSAFGTE